MSLWPNTKGLQMVGLFTALPDVRIRYDMVLPIHVFYSIQWSLQSLIWSFDQVHHLCALVLSDPVLLRHRQWLPSADHGTVHLRLDECQCCECNCTDQTSTDHLINFPPSKALVCIFSPKIYVILFEKHKNVRKQEGSGSMMSRRHHSRSENPIIIL